jgi:acyl-CoA thioester hydrolase
MATKKVAAFPPEIMTRLETAMAGHARLPRPEAAGRKIAMPGNR